MTSPIAKFKVTGKLLAMLLLALTTVLAACGGGGGATTPPPAARSSILRVNPSPGKDNPDLFNPFFNNNGGSDFGAQGLLFETLYYVNLYTGAETKWLANSYTFSSDLKSITFTLNPNIKWNDGQPFTSADVVFTFNLMKQNPSRDGNSVWATLLSGVTAPDANTVTFTFQHP